MALVLYKGPALPGSIPEGPTTIPCIPQRLACATFVASSGSTQGPRAKGLCSQAADTQATSPEGDHQDAKAEATAAKGWNVPAPRAVPTHSGSIPTCPFCSWKSTGSVLGASQDKDGEDVHLNPQGRQQESEGG